MSLYREPGRSLKRTALVLGGVFLVALILGIVIGRSAVPKPSASKLIAQLHRQLEPVRSGLELVGTEYPQSLRGTGAESKAVSGDLARIRDAVAKARADLELLAKPAALEFEAAISRLETRIDARSPAAEVSALAGAAQAKLSALPGGR